MFVSALVALEYANVFTYDKIVMTSHRIGLLDFNDVYCGECGTFVEKGRFCPFCGKTLNNSGECQSETTETNRFIFKICSYNW